MRKFTIGGLTRALVCLGAMHSLCLAQPHAAAPEPVEDWADTYLLRPFIARLEATGA